MTDRKRSVRAPRGDAPLVLSNEVLEEWARLACGRRPWSEMYLDDLMGQLRPVVEELLHPSDGLWTAVRRGRLHSAGRAHGAFRRRQWCVGQALAEEVALIEEAISAVLLKNGASQAIVMTAFEAIAPDLRSIERAAYGGFVDWLESPRRGP